MPRVTEILDTFPERELVEWQLRVGKVKAKQVGDTAKRIGTAVDLLIQEDIRGSAGMPVEVLMSGMEPTIASCWIAWERFLTEHAEFLPSLIAMQPELVYEDVTGHPDFVLKRGDGWGILDVKCAAAIRSAYWIQTAAYGWLRRMSFPYAPDRSNAPTFLAILRLDKTSGLYEYQELTKPEDLLAAEEVWLAYRKLYQWRERTAEQNRRVAEEESHVA